MKSAKMCNNLPKKSVCGTEKGLIGQIYKVCETVFKAYEFSLYDSIAATLQEIFDSIMC